MTEDKQLDTLRGTILAVDDSPTIRKLVSMTMEGQGYRVVVAADGIEALAILKEEHPDMILCDISMPKLDGYQFCKIIKGSRETKHIPVVMLSGKDGLFDKVRGKMAGCANYITKPFEPDVLIAEVRKYVKPALIPMSPHRSKKKASSTQEYMPQIKTNAAEHEDGDDDGARLLSEHLSGIVMPDMPYEGRAAAGAATFEAHMASPAPQSAGTVKKKETNTEMPQSSLRADDLPELPEVAPSRPQKPLPKPAAAGPDQGTVELDKLLAELEQDDEPPDDALPRGPFRSRCPGCKTVFRNVRPDDFDKHARCKKCGTRFHLGDERVQ